MRFHWWGSGAAGSLMRLFGRALRSVKPRYMCALHVPERVSCPTDTHFMQNTERVVRVGIRRLEEQAHGREAWLTVTACSLTGSRAGNG